MVSLQADSVLSRGMRALVSSLTQIADFIASFPALVLVSDLLQTIRFPSCSTSILTQPSSACVDKIVRELDLYSANTGPSKNKKLFPEPMGALIRNLP
jgi:hypothetical protein